MPVEEVIKAVEKKNVLVGIRIDSHSRDLLSWAIVKVAEPGDCVIAIHVCRSSDQASKNRPLLDDYLEVYEDLCSIKKVHLTGKIVTGSSVRRILVTEAKNYAAVAVVVGISKRSKLRGWASKARHCTKRLHPTTDVLAIHNGRIVFRRFNNNELPGVRRDPRPSFLLMEARSPREMQSEFGSSEIETEQSSFDLVQNSEDEARYSYTDSSMDRSMSIVTERRSDSLKSSSSFLAGDVVENRPGWPLLRRASSAIPEAMNARDLSVVQWVMSLPNRSPQQSVRFSTILEKPMEREMSEIVDDSIRHSSLDELREGLRILLKTSSSNLRWFSYEILKSSTSQFSSDNLIGKGGCNRVYKGILPDGKHVAVKIMKSSKEAWKDFAREVEIISLLEHRHITPLLGVCIEDSDLLSVYEYLPKGSLEEYLQGKCKHFLPWEVRYNIAVGIAEALNYLHECSRPVIHRDVKSSNILLSDRFESQLSDFGLAIWGPKASSFMTEYEVVGTFGYLAPEYFMYGKVSDKIDVYAFGVVLLELISGRKPIGYETSKGQESLVMWAKPIIENGDVKSLLDPDLDGKVDEDQMQRMVLAATLCITRAARLRPKMREVLKLLRGDTDFEKWANYLNKENENLNSPNANDDEVYPDSSADLHMELALLDVDDDSTSLSSMEQSNVFSFEEYLKQRWSRSSSFN